MSQCQCAYMERHSNYIFERWDALRIVSPCIYQTHSLEDDQLLLRELVGSLKVALPRIYVARQMFVDNVGTGLFLSEIWGTGHFFLVQKQYIEPFIDTIQFGISIESSHR